MPQWDLTNNETGDTLTIEADQEPSQADIHEIFQKHGPQRQQIEKSVAPLRGIKLTDAEKVELESLQAGRGRPRTGMEAGTEFTTAIAPPILAASGAALTGVAAGLEKAGQATDWIQKNLEASYESPEAKAGRAAGRGALQRVGLGGLATPELAEPIPEPEPGEEGVGASIQKFAHGLTTKGSQLTLPMAAAGGIVGKGVQVMYAASAAAGTWEALQRIADAETPEQRTTAISDAVLNGLLAGHMGFGLAKGKPERIVSAAVKDADGKIHVGPNHPRIVAKLGWEGFDTRESRNTEQFGFFTDAGRFVDRDKGAKIAKMVGQQLEPFEVDPRTGKEQAHSDEVAAKPGSDQPLGDTKQPVEEVEEEKPTTQGAPDASKISTTTEVHGDVRAQPVSSAGEVPIKEGSEGVQPPAQEEKGPAGREVVLKPGERGKIVPLSEKPENISKRGPLGVASGAEEFEEIKRKWKELYPDMVKALMAERGIPQKQAEKLVKESFKAWSKLPPGQVPQERANPLGETATPEPPTGGRADPSAAEPERPNIYGIARRVRDARAEADLVKDVAPGTGLSAKEHVERGRAELARDPQAGINALAEFEADPKKAVSDYAIEVTRAHGEQLQKISEQVRKRYGYDSDEYRSARKALDDWDERTRPLQTASSESMRAQQGETDVNDGTFTGISRAYEKLTGGEKLTPEQEQTADKMGKEKEQADKGVLDTTEKFVNEVATVGMTEAERRAFDAANKTVREAAVRMATAETQARVAEEVLNQATEAIQEDARQRARAAGRKTVIDADVKAAQEEGKERIRRAKADKAAADAEVKAAEAAAAAAARTVREHSVQVAAMENKARIAAEKLRQAKEKVQQDAARRAASSDTVRRAAARLAAAESRARTAKAARDKEIADLQVKAAQRDLLAAQEAVRDAAIKLAERDNKARVSAATRAKQVADVQLKAAQDAKEAAAKAVIDAARRAAQKQAADLAKSPYERVIAKAREYIATLQPGYESLSDIRQKIAADLGLSLKQVTQLLAKTPKIKFLMDDVWRKQKIQRNLEVQARRWVYQQANPSRVFLEAIPRAFFTIKVLGHGRVALGTHAPMLLFDPRFRKIYFEAYHTMGAMLKDDAFHEMMMRDLKQRGTIDPHTGQRRPGYYDFAQRNGLQNNPDAADEFADLSLLRKLSQRGNRGYSVLKILRQDLFDHHFGRLNKTLQTDEMARAIADTVNHITGVTEKAGPPGSALALFAPRLEFSRAAFLVTDPARAIGTGVKAAAQYLNPKLPRRLQVPSRLLGEKVTDAEKWFAVEQAKSKAIIAATYASLLAANQALIALVGSDQNINVTNPMRADFLKFKVPGMDLDVGYGSAMISMARLPVRLWFAVLNEGKLNKIVYEDEKFWNILGGYLRSQMSPFAGTVTDLAIGRDYQERPLPRAAFGTIEGKKTMPKRLRRQGLRPYTWLEYAAESQAPIPVQEAVKIGINDILSDYNNWGPEQYKEWGKAAISLFIAYRTGARVSEDVPEQGPRPIP